jgi:hypothetical protein
VTWASLRKNKQSTLSPNRVGRPGQTFAGIAPQEELPREAVYNWAFQDSVPETPEDKARKTIDDLLDKAGWLVQDRDKANVGA